MRGEYEDYVLSRLTALPFLDKMDTQQPPSSFDPKCWLRKSLLYHDFCLYQFEHAARSKRETTTEMQRKCCVHSKVQNSVVFVSIYIAPFRPGFKTSHL